MVHFFALTICLFSFGGHSPFILFIFSQFYILKINFRNITNCPLNSWPCQTDRQEVEKKCSLLKVHLPINDRVGYYIFCI